MRQKLLILIISFLLISCNTGENSGAKAFIGSWRNNDGAQLILKSNSAFIGISLPTKLFFRGDTATSLSFNGSGHWYITDWKFQFPNITLYFDSTGIMKSTVTKMCVAGSGLWEYRPPWNTMFTWIEEEGGERYEFIQQK